MQILQIQQTVKFHAKSGDPAAVKAGAAFHRGMELNMRKVRNAFKQIISLTLALALVLSILPTSVFAEPAPDPKVLAVILNETRTLVTLRFDREIELAASSFTGRVKLSKEGKSLASLSSGTKYAISGYDLLITLSTPLTTSDNYFRINAGTLVGQNNDIDTDLFDARGPELVEKNPVTYNATENYIKIKFKSSIKGFPNNDSLKNGYIKLARSGSSFNETIPEDDISIDNDAGEIILYLSEPLTGTRAKVRIAAGKLQNRSTGNINLNDITTPAIDASHSTSTPELDRVEVSADRATVTLYFTAYIKNAYTTGVSASVANSLLKSHILISRGGSSKYEPLGGEDTLTIGSNYLRINFDEPITASKNYIKIEKTSLTDSKGNYIFEDIITDNITSGTTSASAKPAYASAFLSSSKKIVIYFTTPIQKSSDITTSELRERISISRQGGAYQALTSSDSVTFSENAMTITLRNELTGSGNRVKVLGNTLSSKTGVLLSTTFTTSALVAGMSDSSSGSNNDYYDSEAPEYSDISYDSSAQRIRITFNRDIRKVSSANFNENIYISRDGGSFTTLSSSDIVTISPSNALTIVLSKPLSGSQNAIRIAGNTLADYDSGYVQNSTITTDYFSASGSSSSGSASSAGSTYSGNVTATLSDDFYSVTLRFDEPIYNNTDSLDALKSKIQISRNGSFDTLGSNDYVRIDSAANEIFIMLEQPATEYSSQIKILSGALKNADEGSFTGTISTLPLGEANGEIRTYINNKAVEGIATAQNNGSSVTATIADASLLSSYSRAIELLVKIPGTATNGTLNISGSAVEEIKRYGGKIALSLGNATYYLPTSNITSIASGDTLSINLSTTASSITQKLASSSSSDSFTIEAPAVDFSAKVITASGQSTDITHNAFAEKRFMLKNPSSNRTSFTVVRIENSGMIVPVPSSNTVNGGVVYITAKTRVDGDYAAISASHELPTTSWVQNPTNVLASRLVLTTKSGTSIKGDEQITRSETATLLVRTLGVMADASGASPFFDMISSDSYYNAVMSAYKYQLILGLPDGTFTPDKKLTRAEAMTILARAMRFMDGKSVSASSEMSLSEATSVLSKFTDAGTVDDWAKVDIAECVKAGVVNGDNHGRVNPKSYVTRAELIQLMYNLLDSYDMI